MALVVFEFSLVELTIGPIKFAFAVLFASGPLAFKHGAISPLEVAIAIHLVVGEGPLENFTFGGNTATQAVALTLREVPLIDGAIRVDLDAFAIGFSCGLINLTPVHGPALPLVKSFNKRSLLVSQGATCQVFQ